jgi:hypothetical protein
MFLREGTPLLYDEHIDGRALICFFHPDDGVQAVFDPGFVFADPEIYLVCRTCNEVVARIAVAKLQKDDEDDDDELTEAPRVAAEKQP